MQFAHCISLIALEYFCPKIPQKGKYYITAHVFHVKIWTTAIFDFWATWQRVWSENFSVFDGWWFFSVFQWRRGDVCRLKMLMHIGNINIKYLPRRKVYIAANVDEGWGRGRNLSAFRQMWFECLIGSEYVLVKRGIFSDTSESFMTLPYRCWIMASPAHISSRFSRKCPKWVGSSRVEKALK